MFDILKKFNDNGSFIYKSTHRLNEKCNAPTDKIGIYLVYDKDELIYIGRSGKINDDGSIFTRQGGIKNRLVAGKQFGEPRRNSWANQMNIEGIDELKIYWYVTYDSNNKSCPEKIERELLISYKKLHNRRPKWNKQG